jgi:hypothetical protein
MNTTESVEPTVDSPRALPGRLAGVRDELRTQLARRAARKALARDLAAYTTESDIDDLNATLDRYDEREVAEIRQILNRQRAA